MTSVLTSAVLLNLDGYVGELLSHFPIQYAAVGILGLPLFVLHRNPAYVILCAFLCLVNTARIYPYLSVSRNDAQADGANLKVMVANVRTSNSDYRDLVRRVRELKPTIAVVLEVNQRWLDGLSPLKEFYPHRIEIPRPDNFGIVVFSSLPLLNAHAGTLAKGQPPSIRAEIRVGDKSATIWGVHPVPPATPDGFRLRNEFLKRLGVFVGETNSLSIVLGDLNTTMWSPSFSKLVATANLKDPREKFGILPTWPTQVPFLYIPIDHILVSPGVEVTDLQAVSIRGSDHRGLIANIRLGDAVVQ